MWIMLFMVWGMRSVLPITGKSSRRTRAVYSMSGLRVGLYRLHGSDPIAIQKRKVWRVEENDLARLQLKRIR